MSKKSDMKDALKTPDAFIGTSSVILKWIEDNAAVVFSVIAIATLGGVGYTGYTYWQSHREAQASEAIYKYEADLRKAEEKVRDERAKKLQEAASDKSKTKPALEVVRPVDYAKDYQSSVQKVKEAIKAHSGTRSALVSALNLSYFLQQQKQFQEALEVLEIPTSRPGSGDFLGGFWRMHLGVMLLENNKAEEAIRVYDEVINSAALKAFQPEALLKKGVALELKGAKDQARSVYEKLSREFPNTEASTTASQYLRYLELKSEQG